MCKREGPKLEDVGACPDEDQSEHPPAPIAPGDQRRMQPVIPVIFAVPAISRSFSGLFRGSAGLYLVQYFLFGGLFFPFVLLVDFCEEGF